MTMYGNLILLIFISLSVFIHGQSDDGRDLSRIRNSGSRTSKVLFETQFSRGRCPERFYQSGEECLFLSTDGKIYSWKRVERVCARQIARILKEQSSSGNQQPNMQPTKGVRQLVLNTPEKTEIFRALFREYDEQNFAVHLPSDYNTLQRCTDGKDDKWPQFCANSKYSNSTCYETVSAGENDICLREVDCNSDYLRLACEFTLPGSQELTNSQFRQCSKTGRLHRRLPLWAWIAIIIGSALLLLVILGGIFAFIRKSKNNSPSKPKPYPEARRTEEKAAPVTLIREEPAAEPMLIRPAPAHVQDTGYLQPRSSANDNTANA